MVTNQCLFSLQRSVDVVNQKSILCFPKSCSYLLIGLMLGHGEKAMALLHALSLPVALLLASRSLVPSSRPSFPASFPPLSLI